MFFGILCVSTNVYTPTFSVYIKVVKKINKSSIKKTSGEIEVTIGEAPLTNHEVMSAVAKGS